MATRSLDVPRKQSNRSFTRTSSKPSLSEKRNKLCLRQSAGDSTGPQVDVAADRLGQLRGDNDVAVQELSPRLENPEDFAKGLFLVKA
jgi:hypothetical protein